MLAKRAALKAWILPAVVFITGACVLVIEVVATRILAPYFGNTIYSYSSIIGVVLAALSIGYYVGGRLADSRPDAKLFYGIIGLGGMTVLLLHILAISLLPFLSRHLSITVGPLVTSGILFLLPAILLGTLSPFAIKLQQLQLPDKGIGTIAGEMFFWSTFGSIAGSLTTGFVLVPFFGVDRIVLGVGVLLVALGIIPLILLIGTPFRKAGGAILGVALLLSFMPLTANGEILGKQVYRDDGLYERLSIIDGQINGRSTRFFQQDRSNSGAMYLDSDELVYDYTKYYSLYKLFQPDTQQALVIGGGAYSIPKALLQDLPEAQVDVSEIEPSLFKLSQQYFRVPDTPRLTNYTDDGRRLLTKSDKKYDLIFSDVYYSLYSIPSHFTTQEFFELAHNRLNTDGVFVANMIGSLDSSKPSFIMSEIRTFQKAFPNSYFFATKSPDSTSSQNIIFVGGKSDKRLDLTSPTITSDSNPIIANLAQANIDPSQFELSDYPLLTDNYAPVEHLITPLLKQKAGQTTSAGDRMMATIKRLLAYGPRYVGSAGHRRAVDSISNTARAIAPSTVVQSWSQADTDGQSHELTNIVLRLQPDNPRRIVVGSHYDSKTTANLDRSKPQSAVPGANDSASGVAVLLETARTLAKQRPLPVGIDFVFFDAEEGLPKEGVDTAQWLPLGSRHFASNLDSLYPTKKPEGGIVIDMVCDKNLQIFQEPASLRKAPQQVQRFWDIGKQIDSTVFQPTNDLEISDDHTSLNNAGVPSFLVIDLEYPEFHTTADTADKCSAKSLATVSQTLIRYLRTLQ